MACPVLGRRWIVSDLGKPTKHDKAVMANVERLREEAEDLRRVRRRPPKKAAPGAPSWEPVEVEVLCRCRDCGTVKWCEPDIPCEVCRKEYSKMRPEYMRRAPNPVLKLRKLTD